MATKLLSRVTGGLLVLGGVLTVSGATAWATSYLVVADGPEQVTEGKPPCNAKRTTRFKVTLRNDNGPILFCTEDVNPVRQAKIIEDGDGEFERRENPAGSLEFLGFRKSQDGELDDKLTFIGMEAGEDKAITFFYDVETGPAEVPLQGLCDFESAEFAIVVCDGGGGCDHTFWADPPDPICESPAKFILSSRIEADMSFCPPSVNGTATIRGTVRDADDRPVRNARVNVRKACPGQPGFVDQSDDTAELPVAERGTYSLVALPAPAEYTVTVRDGNRCASATVSIPQAGATVVQDFTVVNNCN